MASRVPSTSPPCEPVGHRDVVGEGVLLVSQVAVDPPPTAALATAADVGVDEDHPAVEQARQGGVPLRVVAGLVGAVPVEQRGGGAVERGVAATHQRRRHLGAVGGGKAPRLAHVGVRVVARGLLPVPLGPFTGAEVDVGPDRWVDVRLRRPR